MANRVIADELKEIIDTTRADGVLDTFITAANQMVTEHLGSSGLSDDQLKEIERWLAAHLLASTLELQVKSEGTKDANISYQGQTGKGLDFTSYGQMVKMLDTTGTLAQVVGMKKASIYAVASFE